MNPCNILIFGDGVISRLIEGYYTRESGYHVVGKTTILSEALAVVRRSGK